MALDPWKLIGFAGLVLAATLAAQQPPVPRFDVVSIREVPPDAPMVIRSQDFTPVSPGGQYIDSRTGLVSMIAFAYEVEFPGWQLVGLPDWAKNQGFAVAAKPTEGFPALPPARNTEQVRLMMRDMLADRFHLQLHTDIRQGPVFRLEAAKGGVKIREVDPPVPPATEGRVGMALSNSGGRMIGNKSTIAGIATAMAIFLRQPVVDQTGLKGYFDFDVKWSAPEAGDGQTPAPGLGADGIGLLIAMLPNQLGLRVTKGTGPVQYWVVDRVERPSGN